MSFTEYVEQDLKHRIQSGRDVPEKLTLEGLAEHYQVSPTPIRQAVRNLIKQGYLEKPGKGGRLMVNPAKVGTKQGSVPRPPERPKNQYEQVANDLVELSFQGREVFLREHAAARRFGISRTAVRQIFERLAGLGILEHVPRRGWCLRPFRYEYLLMFAEARAAMEVGALRLARDRLVEEELNRILDCNVLPATNSDMPQIDNSLHEYLITQSKNLFIKDFFDRYRLYNDVLHQWEQRDRAAMVKSVRQHRQIVEALIRLDWSEAERVLVEHIHHSQVDIKKLFECEPSNAQVFGVEFRRFIRDQIGPKGR